MLQLLLASINININCRTKMLQLLLASINNQWVLHLGELRLYPVYKTFVYTELRTILPAKLPGGINFKNYQLY